MLAVERVCRASPPAHQSAIVRSAGFGKPAVQKLSRFGQNRIGNGCEQRVDLP